MLTGFLAVLSSVAIMLLTAFYLFSSIATFAGALDATPGNAQAGNGYQNRYGNWGGHRGKRGAVASENKYCSGLGAGMLKKGGNAADAVSSFSSSFVIFFLFTFSFLFLFGMRLDF